MYYIEVFKKGSKDLFIEITTELKSTMEEYVNYYKAYGHKVKVYVKLYEQIKIS